MAQLLGFGTGTVNFFGRYAWMGAGEGGIHAVAWTEPEEPQAALGSHLHQLAYPDNFQKHLAARGELQIAYEHEATDLRDLTLRGEFLYTANGRGGFRVFDVANIDNKGFSERFTSSPPARTSTSPRPPGCSSSPSPTRRSRGWSAATWAISCAIRAPWPCSSNTGSSPTRRG